MPHFAGYGFNSIAFVDATSHFSIGRCGRAHSHFRSTTAKRSCSHLHPPLNCVGSVRGRSKDLPSRLPHHHIVTFHQDVARLPKPLVICVALVRVHLALFHNPTQPRNQHLQSPNKQMRSKREAEMKHQPHNRLPNLASAKESRGRSFGSRRIPCD